METVYIAGGCLWGVQAFIKHCQVSYRLKQDVQMEYLKHLVTNMTAMQNVKTSFDPMQTSITDLMNYLLRL